MWRYVAELLYNSIAAKRKFVKDKFSYKLGVKINLIVVKEIFLYLHGFCYVVWQNSIDLHFLGDSFLKKLGKNSRIN